MTAVVRSSSSARTRIRRVTTLAALTVASSAAVLTAVVAPAQAGGPWFVGPGGNNGAACTSVATRCLTVTGVFAKGAAFANGDTINVAAGTYTDRPLFQKGAIVVTSGAVTFDGSNAGLALGALLPAGNTLVLGPMTLTRGKNTNGAGGGFAIAGAGSAVANNVTMTANLGTTQGGGAYVGAGSTLTVNGGSVTNNTAIGLGGGLYVAPGGTLNLNTTTVTGNTVPSGVGTAGGGLTNQGTATILGTAPISGNTAVNAGGIYNTGTLTLDGPTLNNNTANGAAVANGGNGGAIFNISKLTVRNASFNGNRAATSSAASSATGWGGAIYNGPLTANVLPDLSITDSTIAGGGVAGGNAVVGGAIANAANVFGLAGNQLPGKLAASRLTVSKNVAALAGGIATNGPTTVTDSTLDQNQATHPSVGFGGGLYAARTPASAPVPVVTVDSTDFTANTATIFGGGAAFGFGVTSEIRNGSSLTGNQSAFDGGGIFNSGALTVRNSAVDDNDAAFQGGGIFNGSTAATDAPTLNLVNASVDGNTAASAGGGIVTLKGATLTATDGHVHDNVAVGGGGVYVGDNAAASFDGTDFVNNTASASGGAAMLNSGSTTLTRVTMSNNHALHTTGNTGLGAAIYSGSNQDNVTTRLTVESSTIADNDAYAAAALLTFSPGAGVVNQTSINNSTITGNTNSSIVGAIEQFHPMTITSSTITDNTSAAGSGSAGGLFMFAPSTVGIAGTIVAGNTGGNCSGHPVDGGHNLTFGDATCGFTAPTDVTGAPQLGALADNGGATYTRLPGAASPALDRIPAATSTGLTNAVGGSAVTLCGAGAQDQRGTSRPQGARCDIGSVEAGQVAPTVEGPASADYAIGAPGVPVTFTSTGSPQPTLSRTGALPAGMTFVDNGDGTATLSGTPTGSGGDFEITVTATNEAGSDSLTFHLVVRQAPLLSGPSAATYTVGEPGGPDVFTQTQGYPDATLSTGSTLPGGVTFTPGSGGTGSIAGTPDVGTGGVYPITIDGTNGTPPDAHWPFTLTVNEAPGIAGPSSATFEVGTAGSSGEFTATGFPAPTFSALGLPSGLGMTGTGAGKAKITGTPADGTGGEYDAVVSADNGVGTGAAMDVHVLVNEAPELLGAPEVRFVSGHLGTTVYSADGFPQAALSATGTLPSGVTFVDNGNGTATLAGTAPLSAVGTYHLTVTASNGVDPDAELDVTLVIAPEVTITTTSLGAGSVGSAYGAHIMAEGGVPPYTFSVVSGSLPAGLSLSPTGAISGTPTGPVGTSTFTVQATDTDNPQEVDTQVLSITITKGITTLEVDPVLIKGFGGLKVGVNSGRLTRGSPVQPFAGQTIVFKAGPATVCTAVTAADGTVTCQSTIPNTLLVIANLGVTGYYNGNALYLPSSDSGGLLWGDSWNP